MIFLYFLLEIKENVDSVLRRAETVCKEGELRRQDEKNDAQRDPFRFVRVSGAQSRKLPL